MTVINPTLLNNKELVNVINGAIRMQIHSHGNVTPKIGIAIDHSTGIDLLYRFGNLCMSSFICAHYYDYMNFNHPSKKS